MTDYTSEGATPIDDAATEDPPTVDEVLAEQRRRDDLPDPSESPEHQQVEADDVDDDDHDHDDVNDDDDQNSEE